MIEVIAEVLTTDTVAGLSKCVSQQHLSQSVTLGQRSYYLISDLVCSYFI